GPAPERRSTATSRHARRRWRRSPRVGDGNRLALPFGVAALEPTEMPTWLGYIPLVIFALLMLTIIARGFRKDTWFDRLLTVLAAIIGVAIALFLTFLHGLY